MKIDTSIQFKLILPYHIDFQKNRTLNADNNRNFKKEIILVK